MMLKSMLILIPWSSMQCSESGNVEGFSFLFFITLDHILFFVIVRALFMFPIMVFRHLQRLHKGKYIDTLIFGTFFREPLSIAPPSLIFASIVLHNGKISPKIIGSLDPMDSWFREVLSNTHLQVEIFCRPFYEDFGLGDSMTRWIASIPTLFPNKPTHDNSPVCAFSSFYSEET